MSLTGESTASQDSSEGQPVDVEAPPPATKFSAENIREAEELLPMMNITALEKLKGFLQTKADSVKRDIEILTRQEAKLFATARTLEAENAKFADRKKRTADALTLMRDNLCKIPGFNCQTFQMRGEAVVHETVRDQWVVKGEMLEMMEKLIRTGIREDRDLSDDLAANEAEWRALMSEYMYTEEQLVVAGRRLEDLQTQSDNYRQLTQKLENQAQLRPSESWEDGQERVNRHKTNSAGLRDRIIAPVPEQYTELYVRHQIEHFVDYMMRVEEELKDMRDTVVQVQACDDIRQHALRMVLEGGGVPGRHGIDKGVWEEIVRSSLKMSRVELEEKIKDLNDMTSFKQDALRNQMSENEALLTEQALIFPPKRTRSVGSDDKSQLQSFGEVYGSAEA